MSNLQITELGIIKGGNCEKIFKQRSDRERGTRIAIDWLLNNNCIEICKGWCKITKVPNKILSMWWVIDNICKVYGGDAEIGWHRFIQDIAVPLHKTGKKFRLIQLKRWGANEAAMEFAFSASVKNHLMCYAKPHHDGVYKKWAVGEVKL